MKLFINGVPLTEVSKTEYGHESELFTSEMCSVIASIESFLPEIEVDENTQIGIEGAVGGAVKTVWRTAKGATKAGKATAKLIKNNYKEFKVLLKNLYLKLQKIIKDLGIQLSARFARFMKVADRYKALGSQVKEVTNFLHASIDGMPETNLTWHRFDPELLHMVFSAVENYETFYERVIEASLSMVGRVNFPTPEQVRQAIDRDDKDKVAKYVKVCTEVLGYFNHNKELSIIIGLGGGDFSDLKKSAFLVRLAKGIGGGIANLFTGGKFSGWSEATKRLVGSRKFINVSNDTKDKIQEGGSALVGAGAFLKEAVLGEEIRKTYSGQNAEEFKKDMLGTIGFLTLMESILNKDIIFNVLKSGSLSIKKETDARLKEIKDIITASNTAVDKQEAQKKVDANSSNNNTNNQTNQETKENQTDDENADASVDQLADLYVRLMGSILSRVSKDYTAVVTACLSSTFVLVKDTESILKLIQDNTVQAAK